jgi:hypothetical protein
MEAGFDIHYLKKPRDFPPDVFPLSSVWLIGIGVSFVLDLISR